MPTDADALTIGYMRLDYLDTHRAPRNPKLHSDEIGSSITRFGFVEPAILDERTGRLVAGHGRLDELLKARLSNETPPVGIQVDPDGMWLMPVVRGAAFNSDEEAEAFSLAANRLPEAGGYDMALLSAVLTEHASMPGGLDGLGWSQDDVDKLMVRVTEAEEGAGDDSVPALDLADELQDVWHTDVGQLWLIPSKVRPGLVHRVICGDCREIQTWSRLMNGAKANGVITSPPYAEQRKENYGGVPMADYVEWFYPVEDNIQATLAKDGSFFLNIKPHCEDGERVLYVFDLVLAMKRRWGWMYRDEFIWKHEGFPGEYKYRHRNQFEPIYHFSRQMEIKHFPYAVGHESDLIRDNLGGQARGGHRMAQTNADSDPAAGKTLPFKTDIAQVGNVIECPPNTEQVGHKAVFPLGIPDFFMRAYSEAGDTWVDPFCGSGTSILAAERLGRQGYGIELLPKFVAIILQRLTKAGLEPYCDELLG